LLQALAPVSVDVKVVFVGKIRLQTEKKTNQKLQFQLVDARSSIFNSTISLLASWKVEGSKLSMAAKEISVLIAYLNFFFIEICTFVS
jgi:hypothetical protein